MASLEGWSSTIELHPHVSHETRKSLSVESYERSFINTPVSPGLPS